MSYRTHLEELARALGQLLALPAPAVPLGERRIIRAYRDDIVDALASIHRQLLPAARLPPGADRVRDLGHDPVAVLGVLLTRQLRATYADLPPSDRAQYQPSTAAGRHWQAAARHGLLADAAAGLLRPGWDDDPAAGWQAVADLADISEAFAVADLDRPTSTERTVADVSLCTGLRITAAQCATLARQGPLTGSAALGENTPPPPRPVAVSRPEQLDDAQHRLAQMLLAAGPCLDPDMLTHVATGQARAHLSAAHLLHTAVRHDPARAAALTAAADALQTRAGNLAAIAAAAQQTRTLHRGGARAVRQTGEMMRELRQLTERLTPGHAAALAPHVLTWAARGEQVVTALAGHVQRGVTDGQYLVSRPPELDRRLPETSWMRGHLARQTPPLLTATAAAAEQERHLGTAVRAAADTLNLPAAPPPPPTSTRAALRQQLDDRTPTRPHRPGDPTPAIYGGQRPAGTVNRAPAR